MNQLEEMDMFREMAKQVGKMARTAGDQGEQLALIQLHLNTLITWIEMGEEQAMNDFFSSRRKGSLINV